MIVIIRGKKIQLHKLRINILYKNLEGKYVWCLYLSTLERHIVLSMSIGPKNWFDGYIHSLITSRFTFKVSKTVSIIKFKTFLPDLKHSPPQSRNGFVETC
jgi:hypothetical protein